MNIKQPLVFLGALGVTTISAFVVAPVYALSISFSAEVDVLNDPPMLPIPVDVNKNWDEDAINDVRVAPLVNIFFDIWLNINNLKMANGNQLPGNAKQLSMTYVANWDQKELQIKNAVNNPIAKNGLALNAKVPINPENGPFMFTVQNGLNNDGGADFSVQVQNAWVADGEGQFIGFVMIANGIQEQEVEVQPIERVPEPLTILGTGVVLGAIPVLKKEYDKKNKKK